MVNTDPERPSQPLASTHPTAIRAGVYLMVASDEPDTSKSLDMQRTRTRSMAQDKGWQIVAAYNDIENPEQVEESDLAHLLRDAEAGDLDAVLIYSLDRFGRTVTYILDVIHRLHQADVALATYEESLDTTTPEGKHALELLERLRAIEDTNSGARTTKRRTRQTATRRKKQTGDQRSKKVGDTGGKIPFGYQRIYDEDTGALKKIGIAPQQSDIVRRIFALRDQGLTLEAIVQEIKSMGNSPGGKGWTPTGVLRILNNKAKYEGRLRGPLGEPWPIILGSDKA
jgi:site-specific DNA recombinase